MFLIANFIYAVAYIASIAVNILQWLIIIRALISWVNPDPFNPIVQFLYKATEPMLMPIRRIIPAFSAGIDLSPIVVLLALVFIRLFVVQSLFTIASRLA